jgi:hypothetical protein
MRRVPAKRGMRRITRKTVVFKTQSPVFERGVKPPPKADRIAWRFFNRVGEDYGLVKPLVEVAVMVPAPGGECR